MRYPSQHTPTSPPTKPRIVSLAKELALLEKYCGMPALKGTRTYPHLFRELGVILLRSQDVKHPRRHGLLAGDGRRRAGRARRQPRRAQWRNALALIRERRGA